MLTDKLTLVNQQLGPSPMGHRDRRKGLSVHEDSDAGTGLLPTGACPRLSSGEERLRFCSEELAAAEEISGTGAEQLLKAVSVPHTSPAGLH